MQKKRERERKRETERESGRRRLREGWEEEGQDGKGYIRDTKGNSLIFPSFRRGILSVAFSHPRSQERKLLLVLESGISS